MLPTEVTSDSNDDDKTLPIINDETMINTDRSDKTNISGEFYRLYKKLVQSRTNTIRDICLDKLLIPLNVLSHTSLPRQSEDKICI